MSFREREQCGVGQSCESALGFLAAAATQLLLAESRFAGLVPELSLDMCATGLVGMQLSHAHGVGQSVQMRSG